MNVDCIEIPDGYTLLEAVVLAKCLDENGDMIITEHRSTGITRWEALGMAITFADGIRQSLLAPPED